ncbi:hypothetical protein B296_00053909 [Ensete ventricosum]|uniref:Uncharacterized protein n=1 Tax=Ensete ventricosum TaxID=4639 RepID=A0A426Y339_ENSVE|nr:hypothetical protein B296_00053909 [Ensete ventricosum]
MRGSRGLSGELDRPASIGCPVSLTNRPPRTDSWRPALSTRIDDDKHPTRVARRLLRPSPSDSQTREGVRRAAEICETRAGFGRQRPRLRPNLSLRTTTRTITEVIADQEEDRPLHPGAWIFLTPGPLPDPPPLCFAPLLVQNPNTEVGTRTYLKYKAGWLKGATYYYKSCQVSLSYGV